jgi:uncharacterized radical SAM superfamily Fe-S cluster-containing enzyme
MKIRAVESLCPVCKKKIPAEIFEENGRVKIRKKCPDHGGFEDVYWGDADHYRWIMGFQSDCEGVDNPRTRRYKGCPYDCGLCEEHKSHTVLGLVDVTNRCNLHCQVCFANAASAGYVYEPTKEQVRGMLRNLRDNRPVPCYAFQFSGGEPTVRNDLPALVRMGKDLGFLYIMIDTNGIRIANDIEYLKELKDAGTDAFYLQFDGLDDDVYRKVRGGDLLNTKLRAIENIRRLKWRCIVLVVTLINGVNDDQVGGIIRFAIENSDVVTCVNFQPVSFAGRISNLDKGKGRITTHEFVDLVEKQTKGGIKKGYFYPVPSMIPISRFIESHINEPTTKFSTHPCCGVGTYITIDNRGKYTPINETINVDRILRVLQKGAEEMGGGGKISANTKFQIIINLLRGSSNNIKDPRRREMILNLLRSGRYSDATDFHENAIMIGCMHFMDLWNFDLERVEKCIIHYSLPDGRLVPFCSYNNLHREALERKFSMPLDEWKNSNGDLPISAYR